MKFFTSCFISILITILISNFANSQIKYKTNGKTVITEHHSIKGSRFFLLNGKNLIDKTNSKLHAEGFVIGDFNNDGKKDLLRAFSKGEKGVLVFNKAEKIYPSLSLPNFPHKIFNPNKENLFSGKSKSTNISSEPKFITSGDFNNDGNRDLALTFKNKKGFSIYYGDGKGKFESIRNFDINSSIEKIIAKDLFFSDGLVDLITVNQIAGREELVIHKRDYSGDNFFEQRIPFNQKISDVKVAGLSFSTSNNLVVSTGKRIYIFSLDNNQKIKDDVMNYSVKVKRFSKKINGISIGNFSKYDSHQLAVLFDDASISLFDTKNNIDINKWKFVTSSALSCLENETANLQLKKGNLSPYVTSDLTVIDKNNGIIYLLDKTFFKNKKFQFANFKLKKKKTDVVFTKQKINKVIYQRASLDALDDMIILGEGNNGPSFIPTATQEAITVNSLGDKGDGDPSDGICDTGNKDKGYTGIRTLRCALDHLLAMQETGTISFGVKGKIVIDSDFPIPIPLGYTVPEGVVIDGTSAPGYKDAPVIELSGEAMQKLQNADAANLTLLNDNVVKSLAITNGEYGIINNAPSDNCVIEGNYIGVDPSGTKAAKNIIGVGAYAYGAHIGGPDSSQRNVISGNTNAGIKLIAGNYNSPGPRNVIQGNYIGTDKTGKKAIYNHKGIHLVNGPAAKDVLIGGLNKNEGNLISGDTVAINISGLNIIDDPPSAEIYNNKIGTDATGKDSLPNTYGIYLYTATNVTIGGPYDQSKPDLDVTGGNIIAGNTIAGIAIDNRVKPKDRPDFRNNIIIGNKIGIGLDSVKLPNRTGLDIRDSTGTYVGIFMRPQTGNEIIGNKHHGIYLEGDKHTIVENDIKQNGKNGITYGQVESPSF